MILLIKYLKKKYTYNEVRIRENMFQDKYAIHALRYRYSTWNCGKFCLIKNILKYVRIQLLSNKENGGIIMNYYK